jgi:hypothetical protein
MGEGGRVVVEAVVGMMVRIKEAVREAVLEDAQ